MTKKSFVIILAASVIIWYLSRFVQAFAELFLLKTTSLDIFPTSITETGYPLALNVNSHDAIFYIYSIVNISLWFIIIFGVWKLIQKKSKK